MVVSIQNAVLCVVTACNSVVDTDASEENNRNHDDGVGRWGGGGVKHFSEMCKSTQCRNSKYYSFGFAVTDVPKEYLVFFGILFMRYLCA